jgi:hypothetical protein
MATTYLLNSPVLTSYGIFRFTGPLPVARAQQLVSDGFVSAIGHAGAAEFLGQLLGFEVPVARVTVQMRPGDRALVLRLMERLPETKSLTAEETARIPHELGLLERTS